MVDSWLNIPYPDWYLEYVRVHFKAALFPDAFMAAYASTTQSDDEHLEEVTSASAQLTYLLVIPCPPSMVAMFGSPKGPGYRDLLPASAQSKSYLIPRP